MWTTAPHVRRTPLEQEGAVKLRIAIIALADLSGYVVTAWSSPAPMPEAQVVRLAPTFPAEASALSGVWEGIGPDALPARLVVENVHEHWATVHYTCGEHPEGRLHGDWGRVRAWVLPEGKLFWRHPGDFTFQLSEDWATLVGTREQGGIAATSLMRRVLPAGPLSLPTPGESDDRPGNGDSL
jgi:hypothetical protein